MMKSSPRPKANPRKSPMMGKSPRPKVKPEDLEAGAALQRAIRNSQPDKMAMGGKCRGMGAAKKGGSYGKNG